MRPSDYASVCLGKCAGLECTSEPVNTYMTQLLLVTQHMRLCASMREYICMYDRMSAHMRVGVCVHLYPIILELL